MIAAIVVAGRLCTQTILGTDVIPIRGLNFCVSGIDITLSVPWTVPHVVIGHRHRYRRIADSRQMIRTLETNHPPSYDFPVADKAPSVL